MINFIAIFLAAVVFALTFSKFFPKNTDYKKFSDFFVMAIYFFFLQRLIEFLISLL